MRVNKLISTLMFAGTIGLCLPAFADSQSGGHDHSMHDHSMHDNDMQPKDKSYSTREVMGQGRVNKIMADKHMVNIKHEPIPEMNWPMMNMNFRTDAQVDLKSLKPGQEVSFKLIVDGDNNYTVKEITVK